MFGKLSHFFSLENQILVFLLGSSQFEYFLSQVFEKKDFVLDYFANVPFP
jgi:hypothetical protein